MKLFHPTAFVAFLLVVATTTRGETVGRSNDSTTTSEGDTLPSKLPYQHDEAEASVPMLANMKNQDNVTNMETMEGAVEALQFVKEEIAAIQAEAASTGGTGDQFLYQDGGGVLQTLSTNLDKFLAHTPKILGYVRDTVGDEGRDEENETSASATSSSFRGHKKTEEAKLQITPAASVETDSGIGIEIDATGTTSFHPKLTATDHRRRLDEEEVPDPMSTLHPTHRRKLKQLRNNHKFQHTLANHHHQRLTKLHDAVLGGDHRHLNKVIRSLKSRVDGDGSSGFMASSSSGHRRRLTEAEKAQQCYQLTQCAKGMSFYDTLSYYYSDDIDPATGDIDTSIIHYSEKNLDAQHQLIKSLANDLHKLGGGVSTMYTDTKTLAIKVWEDTSLCMDMDGRAAENRNLYMGTCHNRNNQQFRYDPTTNRILIQNGQGCVDYAYNTNNVYIGTCHNGQNQKWYMTADNQLKTMHDDKCLQMVGTNLQMATCANGNNQKFTAPTGYDPTRFAIPDVVQGAIVIKVWYNGGLCMDMAASKNLYMYSCHYRTNQQFKYDPSTKRIEVVTGDGCLDYHTGNGELYIHSCHNNNNQKWTLTSKHQIQSVHDTSKCIDMHTETNNLYIGNCHDGENQKFTTTTDIGYGRTSGIASLGIIKTKHADNLCMDVNMDTLNIYMSGCHGGNNQMFWYNALSGVIESPGNGCLEQDSSNSNNVKLNFCHGGDSQKWYKDNNGRLKARSDNNLCLDMALEGTGFNLYMFPCHGGDNQKIVTEPSDFFPRSDSTSKCDSLLQLFHRNVEHNDVPHWEGGTVSQVCAVEGGQTFVRLDEIATKLGTYYAKNVADEIFQCSKDLYNSAARTTQDPFPFSTVANPTASDFKTPMGYDMSNRDRHGMVVDITEPAYVFGTDTVHVTTATVTTAAETVYMDFFSAVPQHQRGGYFEAGSGYALGFYSTQEGWKNKYFRADRVLHLLKYLKDDTTPPGSTGAQMASTLWTRVAALNSADTSFTDDDKAYAKHLYKKHSAAITDTFKAIQHGYDLVFGEKTSVGFICGMKEAVVSDASKWPGQCCLDAPFQESGDDWGRKHECTRTCQNPGPFFAGIDEDSCSANGGTWCARPTDCSSLKTCLKAMYDSARTPDTNNKTKAAFASYIEPGLVNDHTKFEDCSRSREYFGFDPLYTNDADICDNVEQLHNTRDFAFLDQLYDQGSELPAEVASFDAGTTGAHKWIPLKAPDEAKGSKLKAVATSRDWEVTNFALSQVLDVFDGVKEGITALECPASPAADLGAIVENLCKLSKNIIYIIAHVIYLLARVAVETSIFFVEDQIGLSYIQEHVIHEQSVVLFDNTQTINKNMEAAYKDINTANTNIISLGGGVGNFKTIADVLAAIDLKCGSSSGGQARGRELHEEEEEEALVNLDDSFRVTNENQATILAKLDQQQKKFDELKKEHRKEFDEQKKKFDEQQQQIDEVHSMLKQLLALQQASAIQ